MLRKFTEAIFDATKEILTDDLNSFVIGLGVSYPNGADGTMGDLKEQFPDRVLDTPVSEATITGAALGTAINGKRPIVHHGRVEFALFAADQIFTQAAKWNYMFGGNYSPSMVIRVAVGRQWGNGPQHTQGLYSLFGGVPGLRVVIPSSPNMAYSLLKAAQHHNGPVIFLEPRWLYGLTGNIKRETVNIGEARTVRSGLDLTIVAYGDGVFSAVKAAEMLEPHGISVEIIDLVSINPIDYEHIKMSLRTTKRLLTVDTAPAQFSVGREIIGAITADFFKHLNLQYASVATPNYPCPTAPSLVSNYYPTRISIANAALVMLNRPQLEEKLSFEELHLSPKVEISYD